MDVFLLPSNFGTIAPPPFRGTQKACIKVQGDGGINQQPHTHSKLLIDHHLLPLSLEEGERASRRVQEVG